MIRGSPQTSSILPFDTPFARNIIAVTPFRRSGYLHNHEQEVGTGKAVQREWEGGCETDEKGERKKDRAEENGGWGG